MARTVAARNIALANRPCRDCKNWAEWDQANPFVFGNRNSRIIGVISPSAQFDTSYRDEHSLHYYEDACQRTLGEGLRDLMGFVCLWGCLVAPKKIIVRQCRPRFDAALKLFPKPELLVLFGDEVIKWYAMRGQKAPTLTINPGAILVRTGMEIPLLPLPLSYKALGEDERWIIALRKSADSLLSYLKNARSAPKS